MKVVLVSLARRGGMVHFLAEVAGALSQRTDTTVVTSSLADLSYLPRAVARLQVNTGGNSLGSIARYINPLTWYRLARRLRSLHANLVHIVGVHEWNPTLALLCKLLQQPIVYTVHDPTAHPGAPWVIRIGDWLTIRLADKVVTLTRHGRRQLLLRRIPAKKIVVIPHPMYSLFLSWRRASRRPSKMILYFGRLEAYKSLQTLVSAFAAVRERLQGWSLTIAGSGSLPPFLLERNRRDIRILNRYLADREVAQLMSEAAIVALPYTSATQSGVVALAQAFARPMISTAVGGLREMIVQGKTGILVPPGDMPAFARALLSLGASNARRLRMERYISQQADAPWQPHNVAKAHLRLYQGMLRKGSRK
jgi:starch synthase